MAAAAGRAIGAGDRERPVAAQKLGQGVLAIRPAGRLRPVRIEDPEAALRAGRDADQGARETRSEPFAQLPLVGRRGLEAAGDERLLLSLLAGDGLQGKHGTLARASPSTARTSSLSKDGSCVTFGAA